jgi:transposase
MEHVAIDLGGRESQICVRGEDGKVMQETRWPTKRLAEFLSARAPSRVIVETAAEAFSVADSALKAGHEVRVVPATLARTLGVGARGIKTDLRDARALSEVSTRIDLPSVHIPTSRSRELKALCGAREILVEQRTKLVNHVRGWLRQHLVQLPRGYPAVFAHRARAKLRAMDTAIPAHIERVLTSIEQVNQHIAEATKELHALAKADPVCRRLMTVPGVGPVTAVRFVAALDTPERFGSAHAVQSYLGLTPGEDSSSSRQRRTGLTKAGPPRVRWALVQACWCAIRTRPGDPMVRWALEVAHRRGKCIAVVALARKMAGVLFALWRDGTTYDRGRGAVAMR